MPVINQMLNAWIIPAWPYLGQNRVCGLGLCRSMFTSMDLLDSSLLSKLKFSLCENRQVSICWLPVPVEMSWTSSTHYSWHRSHKATQIKSIRTWCSEILIWKIQTLHFGQIERRVPKNHRYPSDQSWESWIWNRYIENMRWIFWYFRFNK